MCAFNLNFKDTYLVISFKSFYLDNFVVNNNLQKNYYYFFKIFYTKTLFT